MLRDERFSQAERVMWIGFWVNALLMAMKLFAGHMGRSEAVFADGLESACDIVVILGSMIALRIGKKPFDFTHPYGHGKAESIAAIVVSLVIFVTGTGILAKAIHTIVTAGYGAPHAMAVMAAFVTIIVKEWLYHFSVKTGSRLQSPALLAVAKDHRKDALTSIATLIGVTGAFFGYRVMDPLAAGLTSLFIFRIGYTTFRTAAQELMDARLSDELISDITELAEGVPGVEHVHEIRGRRSGQYFIVDLKLDMDPEMTVKQSHHIATEVKKLIFDRHSNVGDVMIHINPHEEEHEDMIRL